MQNLKVVAKLLDGRISSYNFDFMLDGLLYSAYAKEYHPELIGKPTDAFIDFQLPLTKTAGDDWYYLCSRAFFDIEDQSIEFWHKTCDLTHAETHVQGSNKGLDHGQFRAYRNPVIVKTCKTLTWFCLGDKAEIEKLLKHVNAIGQKHNIGYGMVKEWIVEETQEITFDSKLRPIPNGNGNIMKRIRPPYHNQQNERLCLFENYC